MGCKVNLVKNRKADGISKARKVSPGRYRYSVSGNHGSWVRLQTRTKEVGPWQQVEGSHTRSNCDKVIELPTDAAFVRVQILNVKSPSSISVTLTAEEEDSEGGKGWWGRFIGQFTG